MKQTKPCKSQVLMGGDEEGQAITSPFLDQGAAPRDTEQKEALIVHRLQRHVKEAACCFSITVINMCMYLISP